MNHVTSLFSSSAYSCLQTHVLNRKLACIWDVFLASVAVYYAYSLKKPIQCIQNPSLLTPQSDPLKHAQLCIELAEFTKVTSGNAQKLIDWVDRMVQLKDRGELPFALQNLLKKTGDAPSILKVALHYASHASYGWCLWIISDLNPSDEQKRYLLGLARVTLISEPSLHVLEALTKERPEKNCLEAFFDQIKKLELFKQAPWLLKLIALDKGTLLEEPCELFLGEFHKSDVFRQAYLLSLVAKTEGLPQSLTILQDSKTIQAILGGIEKSDKGSLEKLKGYALLIQACRNNEDAAAIYSKALEVVDANNLESLCVIAQASVKLKNNSDNWAEQILNKEITTENLQKVINTLQKLPNSEANWNTLFNKVMLWELQKRKEGLECLSWKAPTDVKCQEVAEELLKTCAESVDFDTHYSMIFAGDKAIDAYVDSYISHYETLSSEQQIEKALSLCHFIPHKLKLIELAEKLLPQIPSHKLKELYASQIVRAYAKAYSLQAARALLQETQVDQAKKAVISGLVNIVMVGLVIYLQRKDFLEGKLLLAVVQVYRMTR